MARLYRPHVPLAVRCQVAARQVGYPLGSIESEDWSQTQLLDYLLSILRLKLGAAQLQLDHHPALQNRTLIVFSGSQTVNYDPPANDPAGLIYRTRDAHRIKTLVRGDGAQLSDAAIARKRKRKERKANRPKTQWPSRKLRSAGKWPKRTMRAK